MKYTTKFYEWKAKGRYRNTKKRRIIKKLWAKYKRESFSTLFDSVYGGLLEELFTTDMLTRKSFYSNIETPGIWVGSHIVHPFRTK